MEIYDVRTAAILMLAQNAGVTSSPSDLLSAAVALRVARAEGVYAEALAIIKARRADYRTWLYRTQRRWQRETRRPSRARHHDSVSIRERYVRAAV